jgi:hypothetical protein
MIVPDSLSARLRRQAAWVAGPLLLLWAHAFGPDLPQQRTFGFDATRPWGDAGPWWLGAFAVLVALPPVRRAVGRAALATWAAATASRGRTIVAATALFAALVALSPGALPGDSQHLLHVVTSGSIVAWWEPLDMWLHGTAYRVLTAVGLPVGDGTGALVYGLGSAAAGVVAVAAGAALAAETADDRGGRALVGAALLSSGTVQLVAGWMESYTLAWTALLVALAAGARTCRTGEGLPWVALAAGTALALHPATGAALPAFGVPAGVALRAAPSRWARAERALFAVGAFVVVPVVTVILVASEPRLAPPGHPGGFDRSFFVPLLHVTPGTLETKAFLSYAHLRDVVNEWLLVAPALALAGGLVVLPRAAPLHREAVLRMITVATLGLVAFSATWNPDLGAQYDWDLLSAEGIPLSLTAAIVALKATAPEERVELAGAWLLTAVAVNAPWVLGNRLHLFP